MIYELLNQSCIFAMYGDFHLLSSEKMCCCFKSGCSEHQTVDTALAFSVAESHM
jgi:hypothetical protein